MVIPAKELNRMTLCFTTSSFFIFKRIRNRHFEADIHTPVSIAVLFVIAKMWKQPKCPWVEGWMDGWMDGWMEGEKDRKSVV